MSAAPHASHDFAHTRARAHTPPSIALALPADVVDGLVERVAALVLERLPAPAAFSPYLTVDEAAEYARCKRQRIYDLLSAGRLTRFKDGSRVLVAREELDARLRGVAPSLPTVARGRMGRRSAA